MPYAWTDATDAALNPTATLRATPHRPLGPRGFVGFVAATVLLLAIPIVESLGTPVLWVMLLFCGTAVAGLWIALSRSLRDRQVSEVLVLTPGLIRLTRTDGRGRVQDWQTNPHWVRVTLYPTGQAVEDYLTLAGGGREVELGAFLTPGERRALASDVRDRLARLKPGP
jgi:uncharacterized membrane protein